jgi:hypothetical protein
MGVMAIVDMRMMMAPAITAAVPVAMVDQLSAAAVPHHLPMAEA